MPIADVAARNVIVEPPAQVWDTARPEGGSTWAVVRELPPFDVEPEKAADAIGNVAGTPQEGEHAHQRDQPPTAEPTGTAVPLIRHRCPSSRVPFRVVSAGAGGDLSAGAAGTRCRAAPGSAVVVVLISSVRLPTVIDETWR